MYILGDTELFGDLWFDFAFAGVVRISKSLIDLNSGPKLHTQTGRTVLDVKADKTQLSSAEDSQQPVENLPGLQNHILK